jgi:hypothetical protein
MNHVLRLRQQSPAMVVFVVHGHKVVGSARRVLPDPSLGDSSLEVPRSIVDTKSAAPEPRSHYLLSCLRCSDDR